MNTIINKVLLPGEKQVNIYLWNKEQFLTTLFTYISTVSAENTKMNSIEQGAFHKPTSCYKNGTGSDKIYKHISLVNSIKLDVISQAHITGNNMKQGVISQACFTWIAWNWEGCPKTPICIHVTYRLHYSQTCVSSHMYVKSSHRANEIIPRLLTNFLLKLISNQQSCVSIMFLNCPLINSQVKLACHHQLSISGNYDVDTTTWGYPTFHTQHRITFIVPKKWSIKSNSKICLHCALITLQIISVYSLLFMNLFNNNQT